LDIGENGMKQEKKERLAKALKKNIKRRIMTDNAKKKCHHEPCEARRGDRL